MDAEDVRNPEGIKKMFKFFRTTARFATRGIWVFIGVIILASLGKYFIARGPSGTSAFHEPARKERIARPIPWRKVDKSIAEALRNASSVAEKGAEEELSRWTDKLMRRVDARFLPWYFGYWNQQMLGLKGLWYSLRHWVDGDQQTAAEKITRRVQEEFASRVLRPEIAQMEIEDMARRTVDLYVTTLRKRVRDLPDQYSISRVDWERHLEKLAVLSTRTNGNREVELSMKTLTYVVAGGGIKAAKALAPFFSTITAKVAAKVAGKAGAKVAAKTGAEVALKTGGKLLDPIIAIGILFWEFWDHYTTRKEQEPILRQNIYDYLQLMKDSLLHDPETGMMRAVSDMERNTLDSLDAGTAAS